MAPTNAMPIISRIQHFIKGSARISPDIYQITVLGANVILAIEEKLTLIDTGYRGSGMPIIRFIEQLGRSPKDIGLIVLTHNHPDHVGGLAELKSFTSAKVAIHKTDIRQRKNPPSARLEDIDILLEGGEMLNALGGLEIVHTPGHTPGSICLYSKTNKLIIVGDAVRKRRNVLHIPYKTISFDIRLAIESVRKISRLDCQTICFGHGLPLSEGVPSKLQDLVARHNE